MKNKILKKLYLLLGVVFLGILLKAVEFKTSIIKPKSIHERFDFQEQAITQIVDRESFEYYDESFLKFDQEYEKPRYETLLEQQVKTEEKEAIRLFRNPKFAFAILTNNKHQIMIQLQKEYLKGTISAGLIESILVTNPFKLSNEDIETLRKLIGTPGNGIGPKSLL